MHSCQTESSAVAEHSLKYFTYAFVHPSSSEMPPQFSPKHFSSECPLHFICTIATAHLNFKLSLRTLAFNSYKDCLLHRRAHPFWPSSWGLGYLWYTISSFPFSHSQNVDSSLLPVPGSILFFAVFNLPISNKQPTINPLNNPPRWFLSPGGVLGAGEAPNRISFLS